MLSLVGGSGYVPLLGLLGSRSPAVCLEPLTLYSLCPDNGAALPRMTSLLRRRKKCAVRTNGPLTKVMLEAPAGAQPRALHMLLALSPPLLQRTYWHQAAGSTPPALGSSCPKAPASAPPPPPPPKYGRLGGWAMGACASWAGACMCPCECCVHSCPPCIAARGQSVPTLTEQGGGSSACSGMHGMCMGAQALISRHAVLLQ